MTDIKGHTPAATLLADGGLVSWAGGLAERGRRLAVGVAVAFVLALVAMKMADWPWLQADGISALTLAIVLGMLVGNTLYSRIAVSSSAGVGFSKQTLLRLGIVLYGFRLTFQDIEHVGLRGIAIDTCMLASTFALSCWLGTRVFGMDRRTAMLIGAGSSVCGAAAVMATEPVVRGRPEQVTVAVSTVVVFGTVAIFLYPALYHLNQHFGLITMSEGTYGLYAGSTIHEVAQVVAAGRAISSHSADTAVIAKMVRVMMLAPLLVALSAWLARSSHNDDDRASAAAPSAPGKIVVPWFALMFIVVAGFNSFALLPSAAISTINQLDTVILATAMAALGLTTHVSAIQKAGLKPLMLAAALFAWLILGGLAVNMGIGALIA